MPEPNELQPASNSASGNYNLEPRKGAYRDLRPRGIKWVKAAGALSEGKTAAQAAEIVGVQTCAVNRWKRNPKFKALLQRYAERIEREAVSTGVALQSVRMRKLNRHVNRIEKRLDPVQAEGQPAAELDIAEFAILDRAYRATLEQAAKESGGQFDQGAAGSGPGGVTVPITINFPVMAKEQLEAVSQAPTIDLPPMARRLLSRPSDGQQR